MIAVLVLAALLLVGLLLQLALRSVREMAPAGRPSAPRTVDLARRAGEQDMRTAWLRSQLGTLPPQHRSGDASFVAGRLAAAPWTGGDVTRLRRHGQALWALREVAGRTPLHPQVEASLDRVAATVFDLTDEEFDTRLGQTDAQYLYHPDRDVRAAYLAGGSQGVGAIIDSIAEARAQARRDAATLAAADALAQQRNAALRAMRETRRAGDEDLHAAWEAQARQIGE